MKVHKGDTVIVISGKDKGAKGKVIESYPQRNRVLVEGVRDYAIFMLDATGHIVSWNAGAERIKGYTASEILGKHFSVFYPEEAKRRRHPEHELAVATEKGSYQEEGLRLRKDGTSFWAHVLITALRDDKGRVRGFAKVTRDITERKRDEEAIRAKERYFSPRSEDSSWNLKDQPPEFWNQYMTSFPEGTHVRVHPLLHWTEVDIWKYTKRESIPVIDLYFSKNGKRYRSLGDHDITFPFESNASTLDEIIQELESYFRGAGWNVIKVVWGREWDDLLARDTGVLAGARAW